MLELILGAIAAVVGAFLYGSRKGRKKERQAAELEAAKDYAKTTKDMNDAANSVDGDDGVLREWLSERAKRGGNL